MVIVTLPAYPLSCSALFNLEYRSLTPLEAEFATSAAEPGWEVPLFPLVVAETWDL